MTAAPPLTTGVVPLSPAKRRKAIVGGTIGNFVEWFDNTTYAAQAVIIGSLFFTGNAAGGIIATFGVYFISFIFRPIGGMIFGAIGDRYGRKVTLGFSLLLMGVATACLGLLPTSAQVGALAPVLLLLVRCIQGIAIGGELGLAAVFLGEHAEPRKRASVTSLVNVGGWLGTGSAIGLVTLLHGMLGTEAMYEWGWRLTFLVALPLALVGLYIRLSLDDTAEFMAMQAKGKANKEKGKLAKAWKTSKKGMFIIFMVGGANSAFTFFFAAYLLTHMQTTAGIEPGTALLTNTIAVFFGAVPTVLMGMLSDKIGRRTQLIIAMIVLGAAVIPTLMIIGSTQNFAVILIVQMVFVSFIPMISSVLMPLCVELFAPDIRTSAAGMASAAGGGLFGGGVPFISASLVKATGSPLSPAIFLISLAVAVLLVAVFMLKETAPSIVGEKEAVAAE